MIILTSLWRLSIKDDRHKNMVTKLPVWRRSLKKSTFGTVSYGLDLIMCGWKEASFISSHSSSEKLDSTGKGKYNLLSENVLICRNLKLLLKSKFYSVMCFTMYIKSREVQQNLIVDTYLKSLDFIIYSIVCSTWFLIKLHYLVYNIRTKGKGRGWKCKGNVFPWLLKLSQYS